jgi:glycosyltransferase involved in cell wall biosynthesis
MRLYSSRMKIMNLAPPLISVVTTTLNCQSDIEITAASIACQSIQPYEWIIQDACSTDQTTARATNIFPVAKVYSENDRGIYDAMNKAVNNCKGDWIYFLQAGDFFASFNSLEILSSAIACNSDAHILISPVWEVAINGDINLRVPGSITDKYHSLKDGSFAHSQNHWLTDMPCHQGIIVKRELLESIKFDTNMKVSADWDHLLKCISLGFKAKELNISPISWYPNGGYSHENSDLWIMNVIEICSKYADYSKVLQHFSESLLHHKELKRGRMLRRSLIEKLLAKSMTNFKS